jgi:hypothetical protein
MTRTTCDQIITVHPLNRASSENTARCWLSELQLKGQHFARVYEPFRPSWHLADVAALSEEVKADIGIASASMTNCDPENPCTDLPKQAVLRHPCQAPFAKIFLFSRSQITSILTPSRPR